MTTKAPTPEEIAVLIGEASDFNPYANSHAYLIHELGLALKKTREAWLEYKEPCGSCDMGLLVDCTCQGAFQRLEKVLDGLFAANPAPKEK